MLLTIGTFGHEVIQKKLNSDTMGIVWPGNLLEYLLILKIVITIKGN